MKITKEVLEGMIADVIGEQLSVFMERQKDAQSDAKLELQDLFNKSNAARKTPEAEQRRKQVEAVVFMQAVGRSAQAAKGGTFKKPEEYAKEWGFDNVAKVLGTTDADAGGLLVEPTIAAEFIDFLRAKTVIMELGARSIDMPSGQLGIKRANSGAVAAYRGESSNATVSQLGTGEVVLDAKILDVLTPASNQLLSRSSLNNIELIRDDLVDAASDKMDSTMLRGVGGQFEPKGLLFQAAAANKFDETNLAGTVNGSTLTELINDLARMMKALMDANIRMTRLGWAAGNGIWSRFFSQLDDNGNPVFRDELVSRGSIYGIPLKQTTNIPQNLVAASAGGAAKGSELYLVDFFEILVGQTETMRVSVSTEASYDDGSGLKSAFQRGETLIKVEMEHDMSPRRNGTEIVVLESVTWGQTP